jgi:hypothetical protein
MALPLKRLLTVALVFLALVGIAAPVAAQEPRADMAFNDDVLRDLSYPEINIGVSPDGVTAPSTLEAGYYLVTLSATGDYVAYVDFMQPPAGLTQDEATKQALAAARDDLAQEGWGYAGGNNTFKIGVPTSFVIFLVPGEYQIAASYYKMEQGSEEIMRLTTLSVTAGATPASTPVAEPEADVTLEMTDELRFHVTADPVAAGPQLWKITNTGMHHAHHVVMVRLPEGITADQIVAEFNGFMAGTPPAGQPVMAQFTYVGYAALQSGGQTTWVGFDLDPGPYAVLCFISDGESGRPHLADGMVSVFTVI